MSIAPAAAQIVSISASTATGSQAVSGLGTISAGDLIIVECIAAAATATTTWSQTAGPSCTKFYEATGSTQAESVWFHVCDGTETGTLTFSRSTTAGVASVVFSRWTGVDPTTPIAAAVGIVSVSSTSMSMPTLTSTVANSLSVQYGVSTATATWGHIATTYQSTTTADLATIALPTIGATGAYSWSKSGVNQARGIHVILNPYIPPPVPLTSVMIDGVEKVITSSTVMIDGVEKIVSSGTVMIAGTEKTSSH